MQVLGYSEGYHDAAAAVVDGSNILFAAHSERYSKIKGDKIISPHLKQYIDNNYNIECNSFYEKPWLKRYRQFLAGQKSWRQFRKLSWKPSVTQYHHISHLASAFQTSSFDSAIGLVIDAIGEMDTVSFWACEYVNDKAEYKCIWRRKYPFSLGLFYSAMTQRVGLKPMEDEYILMGMSAYGNPYLYKKEMLDQLNKNNHQGAGKFLPGATDEDIAAGAQLIINKALYHMIRSDIKLNNNIVIAGGVALNCVALQYACKRVGDVNVWISPNPGDAGAALGAAALVERKRLNWDNSFLGYELPEIDFKPVVKHLNIHGIAGVAAGKAEFGPRALGNRSLLADPRTIEMKDKVNVIKKRQKFRPFAPVVLEEHADKYFEMPKYNRCEYMQFAVKCKEPKKIPAVVHKDGTSRVQVVGKDSNNKRMFEILQHWYRLTGCPVLLNTSLNIKGQPMINDLEDIYKFETQNSVKVFHARQYKR